MNHVLEEMIACMAGVVATTMTRSPRSQTEIVRMTDNGDFFLQWKRKAIRTAEKIRARLSFKTKSSSDMTKT